MLSTKRTVQTTDNIIQISEYINKLITNDNYSTSLEYTSELLKYNIDDKELFEYLMFTKNILIPVHELNINMSNIFSEQQVIGFYNSYPEDKIIKCLQRFLISYGNLDDLKMTWIIKNIPENIQPLLFDNILEINPLLMYHFENDLNLSDFQIVLIMDAKFKKVFDEKCNNSDLLVVDFKSLIYEKLNCYILTSFIDNVNIRYHYNEFCVYDFFPNIDLSCYDWFTDNLVDELFKCYHVIKLGMTININTIMSAACWQISYNIYKYLPDYLKNDHNIINQYLYYNKCIINLIINKECVYNFIKKDCTLLKYIDNIDYKMCYLAYKHHGKMVISDMPDNLAMLFCKIT